MLSKTKQKLLRNANITLKTNVTSIKGKNSHPHPPVPITPPKSNRNLGETDHAKYMRIQPAKQVGGKGGNTSMAKVT